MLFRANLHRVSHEGSDFGSKLLKQKLLNRNFSDGIHLEMSKILCKVVGVCIRSLGESVQVFI